MDNDAVLCFLSPTVRTQLSRCTRELVFLILCTAFTWVCPAPRSRLSLATLSSSDVYHLTRFKTRDIKRVPRSLRLPKRITTPSGRPFTREEVFLLLVRLAWPLHLQTIQLFFWVQTFGHF